MGIVERRPRLGVGLSLGAGIALGLLWAFGCPILLGLDAPRLQLFAGGLASGLCAVALLARGPLGARGAARILLGLTLGGATAATFEALALGRTLGVAPAVALALACLGAAIAVGLVAAI